jgi:hypothetical protein
MLAFDHPMLAAVAGMACLAAAFPLAWFFFDDFDTFKEEFLGLFLQTPAHYFKVIGFAGSLAIIFIAVYSLASRVVTAA